MPAYFYPKLLDKAWEEFSDHLINNCDEHAFLIRNKPAIESAFNKAAVGIILAINKHKIKSKLASN